MNRKTILATALLAATSMAFAADKPSSPPGGGDSRPAPTQSDFGDATADRAQSVGEDADLRETMGEDTSAAARSKHDEPVDDDDDTDDDIPDVPPPDTDPEPIDPVEPDQDGDGIPDDDDGDDDGDGVIDEIPDRDPSAFGQQNSELARDDDDDEVATADRAHHRNELRNQDTDGDGTNDYLDADDDGDGISDSEEQDEDLDDGPVDETGE